MRFEAAFMSERDDWETPQKLFDELDSVYHFTLDPCSTDANAKCSKHYTRTMEGCGSIGEFMERHGAELVERCKRLAGDAE